jgi:hypothetical protein
MLLAGNLLGAAEQDEQGEQAELVYAEGEGFTLVREGEDRFYDLWEEPAEGLILQGGDLLLTEAGTWLEIRLADSLIKVAENTTFTLKTLQDAGGTFEVAYGRVRARVENLTADSPFWIGGSDTVAGVRGTDFGYDLFYDPLAPEKKSVNVYCFKGKVEVVRQLKPLEDEEYRADEDFSRGKELTSSVILHRNEMVSVDSSKPHEPLARQRLDREVKEFWERNTFLYEPPEEEAGEEGPEEGLSSGGNAFKIFHNDVRRLRQGAAIAGISGSLMAAGGAAAWLMGDDANVGMGLTWMGSALIAAGGYFFVRSLVLQNN